MCLGQEDERIIPLWSLEFWFRHSRIQALVYRVIVIVWTWLECPHWESIPGKETCQTFFDVHGQV